MKLEKQIIVTPPPYYNEKTKQIIKNQQKIVLNELEVTFEDKPKQKMLYAKIDGFPGVIALYWGKEYDELGDWTKSQLENRTRERLGENPEKILEGLFPKSLETHPNGPGTILSGMLSAIGITSSPTCSCRQRAIKMNEMGNDWCLENMSEIMSWLKEEATKRKLLFIETIAKMIVNRAISKSQRLLAKEK